MSYEKSIVLDLDDTISSMTTQGWENAVPILSTIEKMRELKSQGWTLHIVTARGQISCNGDSEKARQKYETQITNWLNKYEIPFDSLSFQKKLAMYYVDDKALRPDEFADLKIQTLEKGKSGATIVRQGDRIYKTASNSRQVAYWYDNARHFFKVPKVHSIIGDTICLEYIESESGIDGSLNLDKIFEILKKFKELPPLVKETSKEEFFDRIDFHLRINPIFDAEETSRFLSDLKIIYSDQIEASFNHGDFGIENLLRTKDSDLYMIDPIIEDNLFGCWHLDVAKLIATLRLVNQEYLISIIQQWYMTESGFCYPTTMKFLEIVQLVRTVKYLSEEEKPSRIQLIRDLYAKYQSN